MTTTGEEWADATTRPSSPTSDADSAQPQLEATTSQPVVAQGPSSAQSLPAELIIKCRTQVSRLESLRSLYEELPTCAPNITLHEVLEYKEQVEETHQAFLSEHAYLESNWPALLIEHEYLTSDTFIRESRCHSKLKLRLSRIMEELKSFNFSHASVQEVDCSPSLPSITVPSFNGDFRRWPEFSKRFIELIVKEPQFSDDDRLRYLRASVKEASAHLVELVSDTKLTFSSAWKLLAVQCQNRRALVKQQLDKLHSSSPSAASSAESLRRLLTMAQETKNVLTSLCKDDLQHSMLVHQVWSKLDDKTREAWETSLESSPGYPDWASLEKFMLTRAHSLERSKEPPSSHISPNSAQPQDCPASTAQAHQSAQDTSYPCDCCEAPHFIVMCPQFRRMTVPIRRKLITDKLLCRNCCGRHSVTNCKSRQRCKQCRSAHHTMLHLATASAQQPHSRAKEQ